MKILNESIHRYVISAIIFVILCIGLTIFIVTKIYESNIFKTYVDNNVMIDYNPTINKELEKLSDIDGLKTNYYKINVTNNDNKSKKYQIILKQHNENENNIRLQIDNTLIRNLNNFNKDSNNNYIIYDGILKPEYSFLHKIRIWLDKESNLDKLKVNFKIEINISDE